MMKLKSFFTSRIALFLYGLACCLAFSPYYLFPVMWFSFAILAYKNAHANHKSAFVNAFCLGAGLGVTGMNWLNHALLLDDGLYAWLVPGVWLGFALFFGGYYGLSAFLASYAKSGWRRWLAFAAFFSLLEWVRSWAFSGFPWNVIGNIWNNYLPILQTASFVGIYGLGLITVLIFTFPNFGRSIKNTLIPLIVLSLLYLLGLWRLYDAKSDGVWGVKLRLVQPNISCTLKWDPNEAERNVSKLIHLSQENNEDITHIVWPESAVPFLLNTEKNQRLNLMAAMRQGAVLITGAMRATDRKHHVANSLFVLDDLTNITSFYDKAHLVPFGEYTPLRGIVPWDKFVPFDSDIVAGAGPQTIPVLKAPPAGPLVCYEAIFSGEVVNQKHRPDWLINVTNDGWYGLSAGPHHLLAMAQTRAVEEGLPLVRSANTGISAVIDPYGQIWNSLGLGQEGVVDSPLPKPLPPTPFALFGNKIPLFLVILLLCISFFTQKSS